MYSIYKFFAEINCSFFIKNFQAIFHLKCILMRALLSIFFLLFIFFLTEHVKPKKKKPNNTKRANNSENYIVHIGMELGRILRTIYIAYCIIFSYILFDSMAIYLFESVWRFNYLFYVFFFSKKVAYISPWDLIKCLLCECNDECKISNSNITMQRS